MTNPAEIRPGQLWVYNKEESSIDIVIALNDYDGVLAVMMYEKWSDDGSYACYNNICLEDFHAFVGRGEYVLLEDV